MDALAYCADQVRQRDRDRFLCTLFAPDGARGDLCALYAFNQEIANVPATTSEPMIGLMRLQWWRDVLDAVFAGRDAPAGNPVAEALAGLIRRHGLSRAPFEDLLDTRAEALDATLLPDEAALRRRAAGDAVVAAMTLRVLDAEDEAAVEAARHVGLAWGILGLARAFPYRSQAGWHPFPQTWLAEAGEGISAGGAVTSGMARAALTERLAGLVREQLALARRPAGRVSRAALPALLPATIADTYLHRLRRNGHDPFDAGLRAAGGGTMLLLGLKALRGRY